MNKNELHNLFTAVGNAHNSATRTLIANGPGPKYEAAADAADALEATLEVACDAYNAANPGHISITLF
jgi:hypothetical protein